MIDATGERDLLLAELSAITAELAEVGARRAELYGQRLAVFQRARQLDPPITQRELGARAGVTEVAVIQALRQARRRGEGVGHVG